MKKLLLLSILLMSVVGFSQQWTYNVTYTADAGNPGGINTETDAPGQSIWTTIQPGAQAANIWSPITAIPFAFDFYGSPVTHFKASQTGLVTFDTTAALPTIPNETLPSANLPDSTICGFWDEFTASAPTGNGDDIRVATFGTAPNRQFWIKWYSFEMGNPTVSFNYFAVVLEESTNNIYVVDQYSTTAASFTSTVGVQANATTAIQFGATNTIPNSGNGSTNPDNDFYCFMPELLVDNNAGVLSMDNPIIPLTSGLQNVDVTVRNFGTNDITSFNVEWEIDGTLQTPLVYSGPLLSPSTNSTSLNLGSYNFPTGFTEMKFWTTLPNGVADGNPLDDTLTISACTALSGTYTIGGVGADFATINEANNALMSCGITGPVVFNIAPGVYAESITTLPINGSSATNTVIFNGGSAATTSIVDNSPAVIALEGADYVTWKNLTVENTATADGFGFHLSDTSDYNTIDSCIILLDPTAVTDVIGIVCSGDVNNDFTEGNAANYCTFSNNEIYGGEMGIHMEGPTAIGSWMQGIQILNNEIHTMDDYGVYMDNQDSITVSGNEIYDNRSAVGDGIYCFDIANYDISYNEIISPDWGIYVADGNFDFPVTGQSNIVNNMVKSETDYAIYLDDNNNVNIYHNTAYGNPGMRINDFTNMDIRNNIFRSDGDYAYESDETSAAEQIDFNLYWTPASNTLFAKDGPAIYADLVAWQTGAGSLNGSSVESEPFFVGLEDLHLVGSGANDVGTNVVGILDDIDGDARPLAPSTTVDIGADEYTPIADDATAMELFLGGIAPCGDSLTEVYMVFQNLGSNLITSMAATGDVTGDVVATLNGTYTGSIGFGEADTVLLGTINTYTGGTINVTAWTSLTGDGNTSNDTITSSFTIVPFEPMGIDGYGCGVDSALISGVPGFPVLYEWYDAPTGGTLVGTGNSFMVPSIAAQSTYYLAYGQGIGDSLETTYAAGNGCGGGNMFDLESAGGNTLYGLRVHSDNAFGTPVPVNVYYRIGTFAGNETNAAAWTAAGSYTPSSGGAGAGSSLLTLASPIILPAGTTVGIYVEYDAEYTTGANTYTSGDVTVTTGTGLCSAFGGTNQNRTFNGTLLFGADACSAIRTPVSAQQVVAPSVDFGVDSTICAVDYTLDAGNADPQTTWNWSDGSSAQTNTVTNSGTYWVEVIDSVGCTATDTIDLFISGIQIDSLVATVDFCVGDSATLSPVVSSNHPYTFTWSSGQLTQDITVNATDVYTFTVTDSLGCSLSGSTTATAIDSPVAGFTDALSADILTVTSTATGADSTVYDFDDGTIVTGVNETHTYTANGTYTVCQYVYNDCGSDTICTTVEVTEVGLDEIAANTVTLHPNPSDAIVNVTLKNATADGVRILTSEGRLVGTYDLSGVTSFTLDVTSFPNGVYFVNIESTNGIIVKRFVKE